MKKIEERNCVILENEGQKIFGMLHLPIGAQGCPAVVMCHGFAGNKLGRYRIYVNLAQQLAKEGIASLRFDFRGSGESEGDFSEMTMQSEVSDTLKALDFVRNVPSIDKERIGLLGNSFGGAIAVLSAYQDKKIKSLALFAALFHTLYWRELWQKLLSGNTDQSLRNEMTRLLDGNAPGSAFFKDFFGLNLEKEVKALNSVPLLNIHSERDDRVTIDQAEEYKRCREGATAESKWIKLHKCDHDFSNAEERQQVIEETVKWFSKTL